ncbi:MAG: phosphoribosylanthranilate isomerase [candidate division Zixibacteria bacterium]|nr:phosphoribosylanthranilate isomerase [candidate division Zixibacteria bacterium]
MIRIKICGITNLADAQAAVAAGADALGFVFTSSPRRIAPQAAADIRAQLPNTIAVVGVFGDEPTSEILQIARLCALDFCQVHGKITEAHRTALGEQLIPAITVNGGDPVAAIRNLSSRTILLDAPHPNRFDPTTPPFDWSLAREVSAMRHVILAGGLNEINVIEAIETARPYGVDVSSGIEIRPGVKDHGKLSSFIQRIRVWDSRTNAGISDHSADDLFLKH